jgi:hypothetical protein
MVMIELRKPGAEEPTVVAPVAPDRDAPDAARPTAEVQAWLDRLPEAARAPLLVAAFSRIAERIALFDGEPPFAARYLDQLMIDQRGDRQGFPIEVGRELMRLRSHYAHQVEASIAAGTERGWGRALHRGSRL